ncbi:AglZ/HisF2 family acetamidino modification protein [Vogesella indigofera]|uniref:AglZ/HisF2 family acetamidino modification protein n=1 Tax=Vogesella indigofera TaxID=45465 RepID=UPI00234F2225|nr:AglZ/HisF2 family acetamidino modification protein [Vogesella indigofera]MDC7700863.1 AglZ/HisF2 family acetamidino modification protein [Vogesella indigofera]
MLQNRIIPCLLLKGQGLVKTTKFKDPKYVGDPINAIKIFNDKEVDELILLDISATREKRKPNFQLIEEVASECFMPLAYGGGIHTLEDARRILKSGVEKVIFNTAAWKSPEVIRQAVNEFGSQAVVVSIDVKRKLLGRYEVFVECASTGTGQTPVDFAKQMQELGVGELFLNAIDRDGTMTGYDLELISKTLHSVDIPVIVAGGAGSIADFKAAANVGAKAMAAGAMFVFHGPHRAVLITYPTSISEDIC